MVERISLVATLFGDLAGDFAAAVMAGSAAGDGTAACVATDAETGGATDWLLQPIERAQQVTTRARRWMGMTYSVLGRKRGEGGKGDRASERPDRREWPKPRVQLTEGVQKVPEVSADDALHC
jgi:hypothetical protein